MAKPKTLIISGPMDARHVGGVNVMGNGGPNVDNYFITTTAIVPDELPSHTFVAIGKTEVPRRSETIATTIRRPSISLKRSLSKLRRKSNSHQFEAHGKSENEHQTDKPMSRSETANHYGPLRMRTSMSRLRQRVGLDRDLYDALPVFKTPSPKPEIVPEPIHKDGPPLPDKRALARLTTTSSIYSDFEPVRTNVVSRQQPSVNQLQSSIIRRHPSSIERQLSNAKQQSPQLPSRPKRADSGTAIDLNNVPVQERPIPFKEIMAVSSFAERMAMYKKTREYWASADHGLATWTERAKVGPRAAVTRS
jgi:hypothetical protein